MLAEEALRSTSLVTHAIPLNLVSSPPFHPNCPGASIFVSENKILRQAVDDLGLEVREYETVYEEMDVDELGMYVHVCNYVTIVGTVLNLSIP